MKANVQCVSLFVLILVNFASLSMYYVIGFGLQNLGKSCAQLTDQYMNFILINRFHW